MVDAYEIERGRTLIGFPSSAGGVTTAVHPFLGPANYQTLFNPANFKGDVRMPMGRDSADFVHAIFCGPEEFRKSPEAEEVRKKMRASWLYVPVVIVYTPKGFDVQGEDRFGVYTILDKKGQRRDLEFNPEELEKILRMGDKIDPKIILANGVGFAHRDTYQGGEHTSEKFAKDGLVIATYTSEGAKKLAEVSTKFNYNPHTWVVANPNNIEKRVSGLGVDDNRLIADGSDYDGYYNRAFSFGVKK